MSITSVTRLFMMAVFTAVLGMFQFGYNSGVMNAPQKVIEEWIEKYYKQSLINSTNENNDQPHQNDSSTSEQIVRQYLSLMVGAFPLGGMFGAIIGPFYISSLGPKRGLIYNNAAGISSAFILVFSEAYFSLWGFVLGRILIGVYCALSMSLVPLYITEIAPTNLRGAVGTLTQLSVTIGLLTSQFVGQSYILGTQDRWGYLFVIILFPSLFQLLLLIFCPESPNFLYITQRNPDKALKELRKLRISVDHVDRDMNQMRTENESSKNDVEKYGAINSIIDLLKHDWIRMPLALGVIMQMSQQLSGINAIFNYSTSIFESAGMTNGIASQATMSIGVIMILMTLVSMRLIDKLGRRTLHLVGLGGMLLCALGLTISFQFSNEFLVVKLISITCVLLFTVFFAVGPGSIPFVIMTELFTQIARPKAVAVCVFFNWLCNLLVVVLFPLIQIYFDKFVFVPFIILLALFWTFFYLYLPETKNRTFDEISSIFKSASNPTYSSTTSQIEQSSELQSSASRPSDAIPITSNQL